MVPAGLGPLVALAFARFRVIVRIGEIAAAVSAVIAEAVAFLDVKGRARDSAIYFLNEGALAKMSLRIEEGEAIASVGVLLAVARFGVELQTELVAIDLVFKAHASAGIEIEIEAIEFARLEAAFAFAGVSVDDEVLQFADRESALALAGELVEEVVGVAGNNDAAGALGA